MGFFRVVKGYVAPRILVSPDALPLRPNLGVFLVVQRFFDPHSSAAHDVLTWTDQVHTPDVLAVPGVAGAYTFSSRATTLDPDFAARPGDTTFTPNGNAPGLFRATMYFLDDDPVTVVDRIAAQRPAWAAAGTTRDNSGAVESIFVAPLRSITPWQWDWFDAASE
jgi:hypothetical protein